MLRRPASTIVTSFSARVEADVLARDIVEDDGVEALALELLSGAGDRIGAVLGGEADQRLLIGPIPGEPGEDILRCAQAQLHPAAPGAGQLAFARAAPA